MDSNGFTLVDTPIFTPAACEGTTTLFPVNYFDDETVYLTQSGQLYNEATAMAFGKIYCFGPTFRAEKSKTRRHLTEFWMVEPEMAYADLEDIKQVAEELIVFAARRVLENRRPELDIARAGRRQAGSDPAALPAHQLRRSGRAAQRKPAARLSGAPTSAARTRRFSATTFDRPVMVDRYPAQVKAFYFEPDAERPELALGVDVIAPEGYGEIVGGGQRIHDPDRC